jgi:thioredoxin reductase (NADPH)
LEFNSLALILQNRQTTHMGKNFEIAVIGGGIGGLTAGLASARLGRSTLVVTGDTLGGHLLSIEKVEGYPGFPDGVPGYDLCPMAQEQAVAAGAELAMGAAAALEPAGDAWRVRSADGDYSARAVILATGTSLKHLRVPGEERLKGKGVSHCASCDAPLLRNRRVVVAGGGDSALQEALTLAEHAACVTIVHHGELTAQCSFRARAETHPKIEFRASSEIVEVLGAEAVTGARIRATSGVEHELEAAGVFVYIGLAPCTALVGSLVSLSTSGHVSTDAALRTTRRGLLAAGTVRGGAAGRAVASAGEGTRAALTADEFLRTGEWPGR